VTEFRHKCAQRGCWLERRWDSHKLGQASAEKHGVWPFPRGITPSDIDGFLECSGRVLVIETKGHGAPVPRGQERALESLSRLGATVLLQECDPPSEDAVTRVRFCINGYWHPWKPADRLERDHIVERWFDWVEHERAA